MRTDDIQNGKALAPNETIVWRGGPSWSGLARDVLHLRGIAAYLVFLVVLDGYQAWAKAVPFATALHNSVPLFVIIAIVLGNIVGVACLMGRSTRYTITNRRIILTYGIAIPATLSLPFARLQSVSLAIEGDHSGTIQLALKSGDHVPFLKLWPHARPWHVTNPKPSLRCVPQAAVVAGLLVRAVETEAQAGVKRDIAASAGSAVLAA